MLALDSERIKRGGKVFIARGNLAKEKDKRKLKVGDALVYIENNGGMATSRERS